MYFGYPYVIDRPTAVGSITVTQPKFGKVIKFGMDKFQATLSVFVTNTSSHMVMLDDLGVDYTKISDFDLFCMLYHQIDDEAAHFMFEDINFSQLQFEVDSDGKPILVNRDDHGEVTLSINEEVYQYMSQYLKNVFKMFPEEQIYDDPTLSKWKIDKERKRITREKKDEKEVISYSQQLQASISACVNHPGFKYKIDELEDLTVGQFYDSVSRLRIYEHTTSVLKGMFSGFVSAKNIEPSEYDFMKQIK